MKKQFIQMTSGWIPVALLILLTAVFLASQASADQVDAVGVGPSADSPACDGGRLPLTTAALNGVARLVGANLRFEFDAGRLVSVALTGSVER